MKRSETKNEEKLRYSGLFSQGGRPLFPPLTRNNTAIVLGESGAKLVITGEGAVEIIKGNLLVAKIKGKLTVSAVIRDKNGSIAAELVENEWKINPNDSFDRNYSNDALEIKDKKGKIVLQVRLDKTHLRLQGIFYSASPKTCGIVIADTRAKKDYKKGEPVHGAVQILSPEFPETDLSIVPIFRHPLRLAELMASK